MTFFQLLGTVLRLPLFLLREVIYLAFYLFELLLDLILGGVAGAIGFFGWPLIELLVLLLAAFSNDPKLLRQGLYNPFEFVWRLLQRLPDTLSNPSQYWGGENAQPFSEFHRDHVLWLIGKENELPKLFE